MLSLYSKNQGFKFRFLVTLYYFDLSDFERLDIDTTLGSKTVDAMQRLPHKWYLAPHIQNFNGTLNDNHDLGRKRTVMNVPV
jgi:hypothetical protein